MPILVEILRSMLHVSGESGWMASLICCFVYLFFEYEYVISIHIICIYIYICRLKAGGSPELRGTLSLDAIPERSFFYTDGGGGGGVITSCEVRCMMLNPGRCCLVGRCCYVASFVVVYRRGGGGRWGGCNNVMWSALDDVESWKMLLGW